MSRSVGGAAAQGILGGWQMMQESQNAEDRRKQLAFENQRQTDLDSERRSQTARENARQDKSDAEKESDRQLASAEVMVARNREEWEQQTQAVGGDINKIPKTVADRLIAEGQQALSLSNALHAKRVQPYLDARNEEFSTMRSRLAAGEQISFPSPEKKREFADWARQGMPSTDMIRPQGANEDGTPLKSKVQQQIEDAQAAIKTNNKDLLLSSAAKLMTPYSRRNLGGMDSSGHIIVNKEIDALLPAYQNPAAAAATQPPPPGTQGTIGADSAIPVPQTGAVSPGPTPPAVAPGGPSANPSAPQQQGAVASAVAPQASSTMQPLPGTPSGQPGSAPPAAAPVVLQPHTDPNLVMPVLKVTGVHPGDGSVSTWHAPTTQNRSSDPNDPIAPPLKMSDLFTKMGQLGSLEAWWNQPEQQDIRDIALQKPEGDYTQAYLSVHGHPDSLMASYGKGAAGETAAAVEKYAKAHTGGDLAKAHDELVSMGAITPKAAPGSLPPKGYQFQPDGTLKPITGGPADPAVLKTDSQAKARAEGEKAPSGYQWKDGSKTELEPIKGGPHDPASQHGQMGAREAVFLNRTLTSANEAVRDLENIVRLPTTVSSGIFGGRKQGPGLFDATKEVLANEMTPDEVRSYNIRAAGFHRSLAGIESAGLAPSGQLSNQMDQVIFKQGDTQFSKLEKLAQTRQIVEAGLETTMSNPKLSDDQRTHAQQIIDSIRKAVPFTMADLDKLHGMQEGAPNATLAQVIKQNKLNKPTKAATASFASESEAQAAADAGKLPSGTKITIGGVPGTWH